MLAVLVCRLFLRNVIFTSFSFCACVFASSFDDDVLQLLHNYLDSPRPLHLLHLLPLLLPLFHLRPRSLPLPLTPPLPRLRHRQDRQSPPLPSLIPGQKWSRPC